MEQEVVKPKISKGQLFKMKFGYSKSMKRAMQKRDLDPNVYSDAMNEYRGLRKKDKQALRRKRQDKHQTKKALRGAKIKKEK